MPCSKILRSPVVKKPLYLQCFSDLFCHKSLFNSTYYAVKLSFSWKTLGHATLSNYQFIKMRLFANYLKQIYDRGSIWVVGDMKPINLLPALLPKNCIIRSNRCRMILSMDLSISKPCFILEGNIDLSYLSENLNTFRYLLWKSLLSQTLFVDNTEGKPIIFFMIHSFCISEIILC